MTNRIAVAIVLVLTGCVALFAGPAARAAEMTVIELHTRSADEVIPLLRPMLAPGGSISGLKDKIVIRTTPANLVELRKILDVVDAPPRRLLISVRQGRDRQKNELDVEVSGSVGSDGARVTVPGSSVNSKETRKVSPVKTEQDEPDRVRISAGSVRSAETRETLQTVQVLEGNRAFIAVGQSIPGQNHATVTAGGVVAGNDYTEYRDVVTGFYATPRVRGDRVTVALSTSADTVRGRETGAAQIQRANTIVSGRLGEWIEVGSVSQSADKRETGIISYNSGASADQRRIYLKVEEVR